MSKEKISDIVCSINKTLEDWNKSDDEAKTSCLCKIKDKHQVLLDRHKKYVDSTEGVGNIRLADAVAILIQMKGTDLQPSATTADRMQAIHNHQSSFLGKRVYNGRNDTSNGASSSKYQRKLSSAEINDLKAKTKCRICRKKGHWGGVSECEIDVNGAQKSSARTPQRPSHVIDTPPPATPSAPEKNKALLFFSNGI